MGVFLVLVDCAHAPPVLKEMQHGDALIALNQARSYFATNRNAFPVASQPYVDDLIRRIDVATSPYFR